MRFPPMKLSSPPQLVLLSQLALLLLSYFSGLAGGISVGSHNNITCIDEEREALLEFKRGIEVDNCGLLSSWGDQEDNRDCCQWHGVRCSNRTGHVIMLDLHGSYPCLQGKVSPSLVELKHLNYLDLSANYFQGQPIPSFIGSLIHLHHLNLSNAGFQGRIPHQLGNLSNLASLDLSCDYDDDSACGRSSLQWLFQLTSLRDINLSANNLSQATNWLHIVNNLPFLRVLQMDYCELPGPIPSSPMSTSNSSTTLRVLSLHDNNINDTSLFQWLFNLSGITTHLVHIDLYFNQLPGPIPSYLGNLHSLSHLDLSYNSLQGQIPGSLGNLRSLSYLDLSSNQLEGPIPSTISNLKLLAHLGLSSNRFQGSGYLPNILGNLCTSLQFLSLENNNLTDELSSIINALSRCPQKALITLRLGNNKFWGSVPNTTSELPSLERLYLNDNQLEGTLSNRNFSNFSGLRVLDLSNNPKLVVNITVDYIPPFQLDTIILSNCKLGPRFPEWLGTQMNVSHLDISHNGIIDTIPDSFWSSLSFNLEYLNMSGNMIFGVLPDLSVTFHNTPEIDLSSNQFKGGIPSFLGNVSSLSLKSNMFSDLTPLFCPKTKMGLGYLDLSNNWFSGELPDCWMYFDQLNFLRLENNNFSGNVPASIGALKWLEVLHLRHNSLSGELLPMSLENCTSLLVLDLGYNSLAGYIPPGIGTSLNHLVILSLKSNKFHGELPLSFCKLPLLRILDLSSNHISGAIPNCIYNLSIMTSTQTQPFPSVSYYLTSLLDTQWVMWKRKEQSFGNYLGQLKGIDVSDNYLEGRIPDGISSLVGLVFLNLSGNNLEGSITPKIGQLTSLESLDLSDNRLSGEIPTTLANLNYLEVLDLSNNNLCGKIPLGSTQLQTFDASSYAGNPQLCGDPLLKKCPGDQAPIIPSSGDNITQQEEDESDDIYPGLYISVVLGFIVGFWGVCGTLVIRRSWRHSFFRFFDDVKDRLYVMVAVNLARAWRRPRS